MYSICFNVRINEITCPGVWLCTKGHIMLKITAFGGCRRSKKMIPKFPLSVDQNFSFQRVIFGGIDSLIATFKREEVCIELIQWLSPDSEVGVILARFSRRLTNFFESIIVDENVSISSHLEALMNKTEYFPGIISPKFTGTFLLQVEADRRDIARSGSFFKNRYGDINTHSGPVKQRTVCHSAGFSSQYRHANGNCFFCGTTRKFKPKLVYKLGKNPVSLSSASNIFERLA